MHEKKKRKIHQNRFYRRVLYAYLQSLRACWKPGENINVIAGDYVSLPLRALADSRAGVSLRHGADREGDERKQRTCYHLHAGAGVKNKNNNKKKIPRLTSVSPPDGLLDVHNNKCVFEFKLGSQLCDICFWGVTILTLKCHAQVFLLRGPGCFCEVVKLGML